jgi:hypothetical protein
VGHVHDLGVRDVAAALGEVEVQPGVDGGGAIRFAPVLEPEPAELRGHEVVDEEESVRSGAQCTEVLEKGVQERIDVAFPDGGGRVRVARRCGGSDRCHDHVRLMGVEPAARVAQLARGLPRG